MSDAQRAEKHGDDWGLAWYLQWEIYTSILTWTHSQKSLAAAEALSLKISSDETSLKWSQRPSNQHKKSHKLCDEMGDPVVNLMESKWKLQQQHD